MENFNNQKSIRVCNDILFFLPQFWGSLNESGNYLYAHRHPEYVVVVRFSTYSDLRRWEHSPQFAEWQRRLEPLLEDNLAVDSLTGMETWFTLPGHTVVVPPPKYKMAVVATLGAAPFVLVVIPLLVRYLHGVLPSIAVSIVILLVMSFTMTWGTMPLLTRLVRHWLYPAK